MAPAGAAAAIAPYEPLFSRPASVVLTDLATFCGELARWQRVQNLVSRETLPDVWQRHIVDSLQVLKLLTPADKAFVDIGSGGGLPAIPLAIARKGDADARFLLLEPNGRKASFLRSIGRLLELPVQVLTVRADEIDSRETIRADVITSRAVAALPVLCALSAPFFCPGTRAIFHKGREYREELVASRARWRYDVRIVQSDTDPSGVLLELRNLHDITVP